MNDATHHNKKEESRSGMKPYSTDLLGKGMYHKYIDSVVSVRDVWDTTFTGYGIYSNRLLDTRYWIVTSFHIGERKQHG